MPLSIPLVHIGFHKTGTTWLQDHLFRHGAHGFHTVDGMHPANFAWHFIYGGARGLRCALEFDAHATREAFSRLTRNSDAPVVISNEDLVAHMFNGGVLIEAIAQRLRRVFDRARILITVRRQNDLIRSCYEDMLEGGGVCGIQRFLESGNDNQIPMFSLGYLEYHRVVHLYRTLFGEDCVLVLPYESFREDPAQYLHTIFEFARAVPQDSEGLVRAARRTSNAHNTRKAAALYHLRLLNLLGKPTNNNAKIALGLPMIPKAAVYYAQKFMPGTLAEGYRKRLSRRIDTSVGDFYAESNRQLQTMVPWRLDEYGYRI